MPNEKMTAFLQKLKEDPQLLEKLKAGGNKDRIESYVKLASELGFDLTAEDITEYIKNQAESVKSRTEENLQGIRDVEDKELGGVAGGLDYIHGSKGRHPDCKYDYLDEENCWVTDACDNTFLYYSNYICAYHNYGKDPNVVYICENNANDY